jgi:hypothetical protein
MNRIHDLLVGFSASLLLVVTASAQGGDDCSNATVISGQGIFAVNTIGATNSPQHPGCATPNRDVWFAWTATQTRTVTFSTCGGGATDPIIAAWNGSGCPVGSPIACDDDLCGLQTSITFPTTSGNTYMLQLGSFGSTASYNGTFTMTYPGPPVNDDCTSSLSITGQGPFNFDNGLATTSAQGQGQSACSFGSGTGIGNDIWFTWTAPFTDSAARINTCGTTTINSKIAVYGGSGCPSGPAIACNDDQCGTQARVTFPCTAGQQYIIQLGLTDGSITGGTGSFGITPSTGSTCGGNPGPDVIVGNITDVGNTVASAGLDAFSLGTDACNIGTAVLSWQASTNLHPVIGGTLYRYKIVDGAGRFEQLGMSWLKHAFAATSGSTCCPCQGGGGGLGIGCSDVYGSGLNGSQPSLGPRWQVNAHNGVYTYPPANPSYSGAQGRRLQYQVADCEVTGGSSTTRFFGETTYVNQDDAQAGNGDNNASYVELSCSGGPSDYTFNLLGATQRGMQALRAWQVVEPGVVVNDVRVPNEGLFLVGSHATNLGGGTWHYEYAVHNMNSDRNGGSFTVPIPSGATITNVGFHDVSYHDGDGPGNVNYSGTDWPATVGATSITWATQTEAQNASANAIRWSSTYNFRFDADVGPANGFVTLGLWKTGSPASVVTSAEVPTRGNITFRYCFGDGSGTACPCGNNSPVGSESGCLHSAGTAAQLSFNGTASVSGDTFHIVGTGMPASSTALYFQGTSEVNGGAGATFGDGLRCAGGTVVRLGTKTNAGGTSQYPSGADPSISVRAGNVAGDVRTYQCWYRNSAAFCSAETFNLTNGVETTWQP